MFLWPKVIVLTWVPPWHRTSAISTEHNAQLSQDNLILMNSRLVSFYILSWNKHNLEQQISFYNEVFSPSFLSWFDDMKFDVIWMKWSVWQLE